MRCSQPTIFSKRQGVCNVCNDTIAVRDIITSNWDHTWIHIRCAHVDTQPAYIFAVCLRCNSSILDAEDAEPASNGGIEGYIHARCAKKKTKTVDTRGDENEGGHGGTDSEGGSGFSSQESV